MNNKPTILYVEDDEELAFLTSELLIDAGFLVIMATDGSQALKLFMSEVIDLCILDVMLPKMDGFALAEKIRELNSQVPILFLTAKALAEDRIHGLLIGGDDYITKPFDRTELLLKVKIFLRRKLIVVAPTETLTIGQYQFDPTNLSLLHQDESRTTFTQRESDLLYLLASNQGEVLKRERILEEIWGKSDYFLGRSMDVFISRLRKYLSKDAAIKIENIHGVGFRMEY